MSEGDADITVNCCLAYYRVSAKAGGCKGDAPASPLQPLRRPAVSGAALSALTSMELILRKQNLPYKMNIQTVSNIFSGAHIGAPLPVFRGEKGRLRKLNLGGRPSFPSINNNLLQHYLTIPPTAISKYSATTSGASRLPPLNHQFTVSTKEVAT